MARGVVGALAQLKGRREDIPEVREGGENISSPGLIGGLASGRRGFDRSSTAATPDRTGNSGSMRAQPPRTPAEREAKIAENQGFLQKPEVQAALMQFAVNIMQPVGGSGGMSDFVGALGRSVGGAAQAGARVGQREFAEEQLEREASLEERKMQVQEGELGIREAQLGLEASKMLRGEQLLAQRQELLEGRLDPSKADPQVLFGIAQDLLVAGDTEMAEEFRQLGKAVAGETAPSATAIVEGPEMSKAMEQSAIDSMERADDLEQQAQELEITRQMAATADTGLIQSVTLPISNALLSIGIEVKQDVPLLQALRAQQSQLALRLRNPDSGFGLTGNTSNRDITFLKQAVGDLGNTPEANVATLTILLAKQRRVAQLERERANYIFETGSLKGWGERRKEIVEESSIFTPEEQTFLSSLTGSGNTDRTPPNSGADQTSPDKSVEEGLVLPEEPPEGSDPAVVQQWDWLRDNWHIIQRDDPELAKEILNPQPLPPKEPSGLPDAQPTNTEPPLGRSLLDFFTGE